MRFNLVTISKGSNRAYWIARADPPMPLELAKKLDMKGYAAEKGYYSGTEPILGSVCRVEGFVCGKRPTTDVEYWHIDGDDALSMFLTFVLTFSTETNWL